MKRNFTIFELLCFIFGCTVCAILLVNVLGVMILKIPTTPENAALRSQLVDLMKYIAGAIIGICSAKVVGNNQKSNDNGKET